MSEEEIKTSNCLVCGKEIVETENGTKVHIGGGAVEQKCRNCGWSGGQYGKYSQCPRCGDMTSLVDDHNAS